MAVVAPGVTGTGSTKRRMSSTDDCGNTLKYEETSKTSRINDNADSAQGKMTATLLVRSFVRVEYLLQANLGSVCRTLQL